MADVNLNALVEGMSGKVGNVVLRQRGGRTFLGTSPRQPISVSDKQKQLRARFLQATQYAKSILAIPEVKQEYENLVHGDEFMTPYTAAVKDYMTLPVISMIETAGYQGQVGEKIIIRTPVNYKLTNVKVTVFAADGTQLETGDAVSTGPLRLEWEYTATQAAGPLAGVKIKITATDRPGNEVIEEKVLV